METIKTSPNVEFDVIYADGTRKRVVDGILFETPDEGDVIFHNGTYHPAQLLAATETALAAVASLDCGLVALSLGMCMNKDSCSVARNFAMFVMDWMENRSASDQAKFHLGQMDFQQCAADMLEDAAKDVKYGMVAATLYDAANMVRNMEIPGGANEGKA